MSKKSNEAFNVEFVMYNRGDKETLVTEARVEVNGHIWQLGTVYGRESKTGLHPVASFYYADGKITEELKPIQRKGIAPASQMLSPYMGLESTLITDILVKSRDISNTTQYNVG